MSKTAHLPFRLQPFASVGVQNIWGHKWGHFANLQAIMIINSIIYGEISNPTLSAIFLPYPCAPNSLAMASPIRRHSCHDFSIGSMKAARMPE